MNRTQMLVLPLVLVAACSSGKSGSSSSDLGTGCFTISQAVSAFSDSQDAVRAGTATPADTTGAYKKVKDKLDVAVEILPAGQLKDLATDAAAAIGRARVAADAQTPDSSDVDTVTSDLNKAAPLCKGKS